MKQLVGALAAVVAIGSLVFGVAGAVAGKTKIDSSVTADYDARGSVAPSWDVAVFLGEVRSDAKKCRKGRTVKARVLNGEKVGSAKTEKGGNFEIDAAGFGPGTYRITVAKRGVRIDGEPVVCKAAKRKVVVDAG